MKYKFVVNLFKKENVVITAHANDTLHLHAQ